jgi:hypothetical protein
LGKIENKVSEISKKYEQLQEISHEKDETIKKLSSEPTPKPKASKESQKKVEKFAKMLRTLNAYKKDYKKAKT